MFRTRLPQRARHAALVASGLLAVVVPSAGAADTVVTATPGESFPIRSGTVVPLADGAAESSKTLALYSADPASASIAPAAATTSISVRARGSQCSGAPALQLTVDGARVATWSITSTAYGTYTVSKALTAGAHTFKVQLSNDYKSASCDRNVFVDTVRTARTTTTTTPSSTTSTVTAYAVNPKLRWAPPTLLSPTTIAVPQGDQVLTLDKTKDYILTLGGTVHSGSLSISGGRNVVLKGGTIRLPVTSAKSTATVISNNAGTVHIEGVLFDGSLHEMDAIQIVSPSSTVQVENVRVTGILGSLGTNHSDVIQPYGGVGKLRVDRLTADSNYQGIFTRPDLGAIGSVDLQNIDMTFNNAAAGSSGGYLLWMTTNCDTAPTTLANVYITPRSGTSLGGAVWPATNDANCPSKQVGNTVSFPKLPVTGGVMGGAPSGGAFVPASKVGAAYTSPGYQ